ncbi:MAG: ImmA/IrrE family metallo-endopeptidase [Vulcanimicrobiaceae bacterium]
MGYRIGSNTTWTNPSVLRIMGDRDPLATIIERAREVTTRAIDRGWQGPPFDPRELAAILGIRVLPNAEVRDARISIEGGGTFIIEFNPTRPLVRQRFSLAHEIAHTLFPDCGDAVRSRAFHAHVSESDWELEALCNVAASELLMPAGSMPEDHREGSIDDALAIRSKFNVSAEAVLIRTVQLSRKSIAMFSASRLQSGVFGGRYRLDYVIEAQHWNGEELSGGQILPADSTIRLCTGIGYTQKGDAGFGAADAQVECVGVMGYPGYDFPRVVGYIQRSSEEMVEEPIVYLRGDAVDPDFEGVRIVAFVTNDTTPNWGGGIARQIASKKPDVQVAFRAAVQADATTLQLGTVVLLQHSNNLYYAPIVAQHGFGKSEVPRIRYEALAQALKTLGVRAGELGASVHMPRLGAGLSGGRWDVVREMVEEYVSPFAHVRVYDLPSRAKRAGKESS